MKHSVFQEKPVGEIRRISHKVNIRAWPTSRYWTET